MNKLILITLLLISKQLNSQIEIPYSVFDNSIISHVGFTLSFNIDNRQSNWVAYQLTSKETQAKFIRKNKFVEDPLILNSDFSIDYEKSGFDRGHLAPAADMAFSKIAMEESFYYSNMSPQVPSFNRGIWKQLEAQTRKWAIELDSIYIVTGPIFIDTNSMNTIGPHKIAVPEAFYKIILDNQKGQEKVIAFIIKNEMSKNELKSFVVKVDEIEQITKIDFFPNLEDSIENELESSIKINKWRFVKSIKLF